MLRAANIDEWDIPKTPEGRPMRKAAYVVPPEDSESEEDTEVEEPRRKIAKRYRHERDDSDDEDDIPLMELKKRLKARDEGAREQLHSESKDASLDESRLDEIEPLDLLAPDDNTDIIANLSRMRVPMRQCR